MCNYIFVDLILLTVSKVLTLCFRVYIPQLLSNRNKHFHTFLKHIICGYPQNFIGSMSYLPLHNIIV